MLPCGVAAFALGRSARLAVPAVRAGDLVVLALLCLAPVAASRIVDADVPGEGLAPPARTLLPRVAVMLAGTVLAEIAPFPAVAGLTIAAVAVEVATFVRIARARNGAGSRRTGPV